MVFFYAQIFLSLIDKFKAFAVAKRYLKINRIKENLNLNAFLSNKWFYCAAFCSL